MTKKSFKMLIVLLVIAMASIMSGRVLAADMEFIDDFSAWTLVSWSNPPGNEPGEWLATSNTDSLRWNLTVAAGAANRGKYYTYVSPVTITSMEFDWRFSNDQFYDRLVFELLDDSNNVLWSATSTGGGVPKPINHAVINNLNTKTIKFSYRQTNEAIYGKAAFFDASNQDDWDAFVDNVKLMLTTPTSIVYVDDFSEWANVNGQMVPPDFPERFNDPCSGDVEFTNTTALKWNVLKNLSAETATNSFWISSPGTITSMKFDWKFGGDGTNLKFRLLDDVNQVVWNAATGQGTEQTVTVNSKTLRFEYAQSGAIQGYPGFFSGASDWDALVDNVVITFSFDVSPSPTTMYFYNDFNQWVNANEDDPAPGDYRFGSWLAVSNARALSWDLTVPTGGPLQDRWNRYTITIPSGITKIKFDWRFADDTFSDRLQFQLKDVAGTILWSAGDIAENISKPLHTGQIVDVNTTSLSFVYYNPAPYTMWGKPGLFGSTQADWDAYIDNVMLTVRGECNFAGDLNGDCVVDFEDFAVLAGDWLKCVLPNPAQCP